MIYLVNYEYIIFILWEKIKFFHPSPLTPIDIRHLDPLILITAESYPNKQVDFQRYVQCQSSLKGTIFPGIPLPQCSGSTKCFVWNGWAQDNAPLNDVPQDDASARSPPCGR